MDGCDVWVGDVDGENQLGVEDAWEVELEGGEVDVDEVERWVLGLRREDRRRRHRRGGSDQRRGPAPFYLFAHGAEIWCLGA